MGQMIIGTTTGAGTAGFEPFSKPSADQPRNPARDTIVGVWSTPFASMPDEE